MSITTQPVKEADRSGDLYLESNKYNDLYNELAKGIQSMKNCELYTIEEAWEEIDKI
ncbi:MAG: hypothetical protein LBV33_08760 [Lachnospiraceae bacterium]|jgi:hypothetical protein|nr:hypothetical protein [Lachnospiraceae bacterium]